MSDSFNTIKDFTQLNETISKEEGVVVYFSHEACNVCKVLKPKVANMLNEKFPKLKKVYSDTVRIPEAAGQNRVFAVPTILVFLEGREYIRVSRNISVEDLQKQIERPYSMMFEN